MIEFETKCYLCTLSGDQDFIATICDKAPDIDVHREHLPILAAPLLKLYGSQLVFVTSHVDPRPAFNYDNMLQTFFGKGKKK